MNRQEARICPTVLARNYHITYEEAEVLKQGLPTAQKYTLPVVKAVVEKMANIVLKNMLKAGTSKAFTSVEEHAA